MLLLGRVLLYCRVASWMETFPLPGFAESISHPNASSWRTARAGRCWPLALKRQYHCTIPMPLTIWYTSFLWTVRSRRYDGCKRNSNKINLLLATTDLSGGETVYDVPSKADLNRNETKPIVLRRLSVGSELRSLDVGCISYAGQTDEFVLAAGDKSGNLTLLNGDEERSIAIDPKNGVLGVAIQEEKRLLAFCTSSGLIQVYDLPTLILSRSGKPFPVYQVHRKGGAVRSVSFSPDGSFLAAGGYDKTVMLICTQQWATARELPVQGTVRSSCWKSPT
jgi:WD40 repeat protein